MSKLSDIDARAAVAGISVIGATAIVITIVIADNFKPANPAYERRMAYEKCLRERPILPEQCANSIAILFSEVQE